MAEILAGLNHFLWGIPVLILILGVGLYLSIQTNFVQIRLFPKALKAFLNQLRVNNRDDGKVSSFQALCTALAATVGTGNLAGVSGALALGGPGAIFWMWVCAILGMVIKFAEAALAVKYRKLNSAGALVGGPMFMIQNGLGRIYRPLAAAYCLFGILASFGIGNTTQVHTVIESLTYVVSNLGFETSIAFRIITGCMLAVTIGILLLGGAKRIGQVAELLVPFAAALYILICLGVLIIRFQQIPAAFRLIFAGAFSPRAVTGGILGSVFQTMRVGVSRGVFTNEAGMGTAAIAHAGANVKDPVEQGLMGIIEVFLDTVVICTMTALVILCSGVQIPYGSDCGISLTMNAFSLVFGNWVVYYITIAIILFAFATILGWSLYGRRCVEYLFDYQMGTVYACAQMMMVLLGSFLNIGTVWTFSEIANGLMAIPNLIVLIALSDKFKRIIENYK